MLDLLQYEECRQTIYFVVTKLLVSLDKKLYSTLTLVTLVYKWVLAITVLGGNLAMD